MTFLTIYYIIRSIIAIKLSNYLPNRMIAVIETGGKQYLIQPGQTLKLEKLPAQVGDSYIFDKVLLKAEKADGSDVKIGTPYLDGETVEVTVEKQGRARKVTVIKFKRKVRYSKKRGHRQQFTQVKVK